VHARRRSVFARTVVAPSGTPGSANSRGDNPQGGGRPPTSGPICMAKASPASSPSRAAPGSTNAISARSTLNRATVGRTPKRSSRPSSWSPQTQPRPGRQGSAVRGPGRRGPARTGGHGWPHAFTYWPKLQKPWLLLRHEVFFRPLKRITLFGLGPRTQVIGTV